MKIWIKRVAVISIFLALSLFLAGCTTDQEIKIGVMSMDGVLNESKRANQLQQELIEISNRLDTNNQDETENISEEEAYQQFSAKKTELENQLNGEINKILDQISVEKNLDIILYKNKSYYGGIDITEEVVERLDEKFFGENEGADNEE